MFLVDTNVLLDVFTDDAQWRRWSEDAIREALIIGPIGINPIVYAETSLAFADVEPLDQLLDELMLERWPLPYQAAFSAGRAYRTYRRAGGSRRAPLPDFYIGAHAATEDLRLVTRDASRYRTYFPSVKLVTPGDHA